MDQPIFDSYAIVELLGHIRFSARVRQETLAGAGMLRCDVLDPEGGPEPLHTQLVAPASVYRVTLCSEALARSAARYNGEAAPFQAWQLREPLPTPAGRLPERSVSLTEVKEDYNADEFDGDGYPV